MTDKKGTMLGRALLKFIPEDSVFHSAAEAADTTFESIVFHGDVDAGAPVKALPEVIEAVHGIKGLLLHLAEKGIIAFNFPIVDGANEEKVEAGLFSVLEGYVNEVTD